MDKNYVAPVEALKKLKKARSVLQTVYLYGATGYGKTELVRQYLSGRRYTYLSCEELPWKAGALPPEEPGKHNCRVVVIDDLQRLKSEELRRKIIALEQRDDVWLILIGRSPIPAWLISQHIKNVFVVVTEDDLRLRAGEIGRYLDACGVAHTEDDVQYLQGTAEGNAYVVRHVALKLKEGKSLGPELYEDMHKAFSVYLENNVLVRWDSDLLEFLMQVSVVDEFTMELAEMISGSFHVTALLEQAAEAGNFLTQEDGVYRLRPTLIRALRNRSAKIYGRERVKDFKYNAALYYEMHDEVVPALKLFEECGKHERIKNLLIRNARMNPGSGHYYELRRYYFSMDEREIEDSPVLMAGMSMLCSMLMDNEKSEYWYDKLKKFEENAKGGVRREAQSRLAYLDIGLPHRGSRNILDIMKSIPALLFDRGNCLPEFSVTSNLPSTMNGGKDFCHWSLDDTKLAKRYGSLVERVLGRYGKGLVKAALGESCYERGEDNYKVLTLLTRAQMETEQNGTLEIAFAAVGLRVRLALFQGDGPGALELLDAFEQSVRESRAVQLLPNIQALRCRLALYERDMDSVERWMRTAPAEDKEFCSLERYRYLTKVRCYLANGEYLTAQALLEKLRYYAEQTGRPYVRMETGLLSAVTKERMDGPWQEELSAVLQEAEQYRFLRLISEEGAAVWPLLQQEKKSLLEAGTLDREWLRRLLNETEGMARRYPLYLKKQAAAAADFSGTALSILRLQADGLSVNRIADKLALKPDNVKYHIKENYRKLNAAGKADALLSARSLGLI
ncbi:MAG: LuxR C-terminal-related transcriptional regulator [Oscillospiraceae bacterium]|nr:LuxR C-terminal-related transcriptional regulator [Oscillospiraceae bacterium]